MESIDYKKVGNFDVVIAHGKFVKSGLSHC